MYIHMEKVMSKIRVKILFPPMNDPDVLTKKAIIQENENEPFSIEMLSDQPEVTLDFDEDSLIKVQLFHYDKNKNQSKPSFREFVALDTIPPRTPGEINFKIEAEIYEDGSVVNAIEPEDLGNEDEDEEDGDPTEGVENVININVANTLDVNEQSEGKVE